jgi:hypothetical protein
MLMPNQEIALHVTAYFLKIYESVSRRTMDVSCKNLNKDSWWDGAEVVRGGIAN